MPRFAPAHRTSTPPIARVAQLGERLADRRLAPAQLDALHSLSTRADWLNATLARGWHDTHSLEKADAEAALYELQANPWLVDRNALDPIREVLASPRFRVHPQRHGVDRVLGSVALTAPIEASAAVRALALCLGGRDLVIQLTDAAEQALADDDSERAHRWLTELLAPLLLRRDPGRSWFAARPRHAADPPPLRLPTGDREAIGAAIEEALRRQQTDLPSLRRQLTRAGIELRAAHSSDEIGTAWPSPGNRGWRLWPRRSPAIATITISDHPVIGAQECFRALALREVEDVIAGWPGPIRDAATRFHALLIGAVYDTLDDPRARPRLEGELSVLDRSQLREQVGHLSAQRELPARQFALRIARALDDSRMAAECERWVAAESTLTAALERGPDPDFELYNPRDTCP